MPGFTPNRVGPGSRRRRALLVVVGALGAIAAVAIITVAVVAGGDARPVAVSPPVSVSNGTVAPLDLSTVSASLAGHYRYAQAHMSEYQQIPCWCGCEQSVGHRNLADCFVRADGRGFEAHAAVCGVCIAEAVMAEEMLGQGHTPADVKAAVDRRFGSTPTITSLAT